VSLKIIDASAIVALLFDEPEANTIERLLRNATLAAPPLLAFEVANVCVMKIRRNPAQRSALLAAYSIFEQFDIDIVGIDHGQVLDLAEAANLTAHDAAYLWLALRFDADLVTLDKKLAAAAHGEFGR
jgi:predicted nucleic acid-binding protein